MSKAREFADAAPVTNENLETVVQEEVEEQLLEGATLRGENVLFEDNGATKLDATNSRDAIIEIVTSPINGGTF